MIYSRYTDVEENDAPQLLEAAKAQVEATKAEEESGPTTTRVKRALEISEETNEEEVPVKRVRVEQFEKEVWVDGRRQRALLGLAIGLGARYSIERTMLTTVLYYHIYFRLVNWGTARSFGGW